MIVQKVIVTGVTEDELILDAEQSGCSHCQEASCGAISLAAFFGARRERSLRIANPGGFKPGDRAELLIDRLLFIRSVFYQYILPLLAVLLALLLTTPLDYPFVVQMFFVAFGLASGIVISRLLMRRLEHTMTGGVFQLRRLEPMADSDKLDIQLTIQS